MGMLKDCSAIIGPFATVIVGLAVAYIAYQQWQVARNKLRLDLFDRRYRVFEAVRQFLRAIHAEATVDLAHLSLFDAGTSEKEFLFDQDVVNSISKIRDRAIDIRMHRELYSPLPIGADRTKYVEAETNGLLWLGQQFTAITTVFTPYLGFSHIR